MSGKERTNLMMTKNVSASEKRKLVWDIRLQSMCKLRINMHSRKRENWYVYVASVEQ